MFCLSRQQRIKTACKHFKPSVKTCLCVSCGSSIWTEWMLKGFFECQYWPSRGTDKESTFFLVTMGDRSLQKLLQTFPSIKAGFIKPTESLGTFTDPQPPLPFLQLQNSNLAPQMAKHIWQLNVKKIFTWPMSIECLIPQYCWILKYDWLIA